MEEKLKVSINAEEIGGFGFDKVHINNIRFIDLDVDKLKMKYYLEKKKMRNQKKEGRKNKISIKTLFFDGKRGSKLKKLIIKKKI